MPVGSPRIQKLLKKIYIEADREFEKELKKRLKQKSKASARKK